MNHGTVARKLIGFGLWVKMVCFVRARMAVHILMIFISMFVFSVKRFRVIIDDVSVAGQEPVMLFLFCDFV